MPTPQAPPTKGRTGKQLWLDALLKRPIEEFLQERRDAGASWEDIAREVRDLTGGSPGAPRDETLRLWHEAWAATAA
jgi:hypothetical protein